MRKPIQISTAVVRGDGNWSPEEIVIVTALCDDGSIWSFNPYSKESGRWEKMPEIPQDLQ